MLSLLRSELSDASFGGALMLSVHGDLRGTVFVRMRTSTGEVLAEGDIALGGLDPRVQERALAMYAARLTERPRALPRAEVHDGPSSARTPVVGAGELADELPPPPRIRAEASDEEGQTSDQTGTSLAPSASPVVAARASAFLNRNAPMTLSAAYRIRFAATYSQGAAVLFRRSWHHARLRISLLTGLGTSHRRISVDAGRVLADRVDGELGVGAGVQLGVIALEARTLFSGGWMRIEGEGSEAFLASGGRAVGQRRGVFEFRLEAAAIFRLGRARFLTALGLGLGAAGSTATHENTRIRWNGAALLAQLGIGVAFGRTDER